MAGQASKKRRTHAPSKKQRTNTGAQTLDLTQRERPTVKLDCGDFKMRRPEEFYFRDFAGIVKIGEQISELVEEGVSENAGELDDLIGESVKEILVDATPEAMKMTPQLFGELFEFFNGLVPKKEKGTSESASSSVPGASDSSEASAAD